ncbi:MAG: hypothetical protein AABW79_02575 [Nanoarchaeota archaeon]
MIISPILQIGSRRRHKRKNFRLENLTEEEKEDFEFEKTANRTLVYIATGILLSAALTGIGYIAYNHKDIPASVIRGAYAP